MFLVGEAYAMGGQPGPGGEQSPLLLQLLPFILMFAVIYFLILRPQYRKQKQHQSMVDSVKKGDKVVTTGGIHGKVMGVKEKEGILVVQIAKDVQVEVSRGSVTSVSND